MKKAAAFILIALCLSAGVTIFLMREPTPPPKAEFDDDWTSLFVAVTKGFQGSTFYLGSDDEWSYFRTGWISPKYCKAKTTSLDLPKTFSFQTEKAYKLQLTHFRHNANGVYGTGN